MTKIGTNCKMRCLANVYAHKQMGVDGVEKTHIDVGPPLFDRKLAHSSKQVRVSHV